MALQNSWYAVADFIDSRGQSSSVRVRVSETDAEAWLNAADNTARASTDVGVLFIRIAALSAATLYKRYVTLEVEDDAPAIPAPDDNIYNFDKLAVSFQAGLDNYSMTIPARDDANYTVGSDGVSVILGASGTTEIQNFVTAFEGTVVAKNGGTPTVRKITVIR